MSNHRRQLLCAVVLLLTPVGTLAALPPAAAFDPFARHTERITDRVYLVTNSPTSIIPPFEGNVVVIEQSDGLVIVDAGGAPISGRNIVRAIRNFTSLPAKYLIYTHYHGDHNLGAGELRKAWPGLRIISTVQTRVNMTGPPMAYVTTYSEGNAGALASARQRIADPKTSAGMQASWRAMVRAGPAMVAAYRGLKATPADIVFSDELNLPDPVAPLELRFLGRANTDGDAIVWLPRQRVLATGDVVVHPSPYASASYPTDWLRVLGQLKAYDFAFLVPGHGQVQTDRAYIDKLIGAIGAVRAQVAPLAHAGISLDQTYKRVDLSSVTAIFAGGDPWRRFALDAFFLRALVSNSWKEAKGLPITQGVDGG
jgi:glyoxylase-like metal-dependent hydrolase (beta-lactamase superfamily II)